MARDLRCIVEGPGEMDMALAILRGDTVSFRLAAHFGHDQFITTREERGETDIRCILGVCVRLETPDTEERLTVEDREKIGFGRIFEIEASRCFFTPIHRFRAYYSLRTRRGLVIWIEDGEGRKVFINA